MAGRRCMTAIDDAVCCILRPARAVLSRWTEHPLRLLALVIALLALVTALSGVAECGEYLIEPSIGLSEEYDDNIYLDPVDEVHDYITHVVPGIHAEYAAPLWDWKLTYAYDYRYYAHHGYNDDHAQYLNILGTTRILPNLLYFDVRENYGRTSVTPVRDYTQESLVKNLTDYNALDLNPYVGLRLTSSMSLTAGYQYRNVVYKDPSAVDRNVNSVYGDLAKSVSDRTSLTAAARADRTATSENTRRRAKVLLGARYEYQEASVLWGSAGTLATYDEAGDKETEPVWDGGLVHKMSTVTLNLETGRSYIEDPLLIDRREDRYVASLRMEKDRTAGGLTLGLRNYGTGRTVDERKYSGMVDFSHFLTERTQGKYSFTMDRYDRFPADAPDSRTVVYTTDVRIDYHAAERFVVSLAYRYTDSYSPDLYTDNYDVNRIFVEVKKTF